MKYELFQLVFKNVVLNKYIFQYIKVIHRVLLRYSSPRLLNWQELQNKPIAMIHHNYLDMFKRYIESGKDNDDSYQARIYKENFGNLIPQMVIKGRINFLEYITYALNRDLVYFCHRITLLIAGAQSKQPKMLDYLYDKVESLEHLNVFDYDVTYKTITKQSLYNVDIVKWMYSKIFSKLLDRNTYPSLKLDSEIEILESCARSGYLQSLVWFLTERCLNFDEEEVNISPPTIDDSSRIKSQSPKSIVVYNKLIQLALANGHLNIAEWLHVNNYISDDFISDLDEVVSLKENNLECLKWAHTHYKTNCTTKAIDISAEYSHLNIIEWLNKNRTEGCTTDAMDNAALNGNLSIIKYLCDNRTEGMTLKAIQFAVKKKHNNVIQYFLKKRLTTEEEILEIDSNWNFNLNI